MSTSTTGQANKKPPSSGAPQTQQEAASADILGQLSDGLAELRSMATELGDRLSGAATGVSADAKETWKRVEPQVKQKLKTAEAALGHVTDSAADQLKGLLGELKSSLRKVKDKL